MGCHGQPEHQGLDYFTETPEKWWRRANSVSVVSLPLAPLLELEFAEVAEVAGRRRDNQLTQTVCYRGWMGGKKQQIRGLGRLRIHVGAAAESWHRAGDGRRRKEPPRDRPRQGRMCSAHGEKRREHQRGSWGKPGPVRAPLTSNPITRVSKRALATTSVGRGS